ncbi:MAG: TrkA domain protein [Pseudonocardiales bacterium]|nr:TrkA domain protein [Pseudonocardiales bacterium]
MRPKGHSIDILSRPLPGIGVCQELQLRTGRRVGIVTRRDGLTDLVIYDAEDPDAAHDRVELAYDEANAIAEILGAPQLVEHLSVQQQQAFGLLVEQLPLAPGSPFAGRTLGDTQTRTRTGASIVAIIRQGTATPSPGPEFQLIANDLVVVVGTKEAIDQVAAILDGSAG